MSQTAHARGEHILKTQPMDAGISEKNAQIKRTPGGPPSPSRKMCEGGHRVFSLFEPKTHGFSENDICSDFKRPPDDVILCHFDDVGGGPF